LAVTRTVGGVISGYSAIGSIPAAIAPSIKITIEITHARTGLSMKMRASTTSSLHAPRPALFGFAEKAAEEFGR
jgi:hypothetical protein